MTDIIGADAAKLAGLQVDTLQKVRRGHITLDHWEYFNHLTKQQRDELCQNGTATKKKKVKTATKKKEVKTATKKKEVKTATKKKEVKPQPVAYLSLISAGKGVVIPSSPGGATIAKASSVFTGLIDSNFSTWGTDTPGKSKGKTAVDVHELVHGATFEQMFSSLAPKPKALCLTQGQIIEFVKKCCDWLHPDGYATFFLFEAKGRLFVARVAVSVDGQLCVLAFHFENFIIWSASFRFRVVVPQL